MRKLMSLAFWTVLGVFAYLPFHALFSTLLISVIGGKLPVKGIKELVILLLLIPLIVLIVKRRHKLHLPHPKLWITAATFILFTILLAIISGGETIQKVAGLIALLRYVGFFIICYITVLLIGERYKSTEKILKVVIACSVIVVSFGALQATVLPKDFLIHFGYGPDTIMPYGTIDNNESLVRILSTLRGPNPLGAYLAMLAPLGLYYLTYIKRWKPLPVVVYATLFLITLFASQSRSGWIGFLVGLAVYGLAQIRNRRLVIYAVAGIGVVLLSGFIFKDSYFVQTTLLHKDPNEASQINSDDQRIDSLKRGLNEVLSTPFGHGVGSSGPASNYGKNPVIIENIYLDVAYQIGWLGFVLYLAVVSYTGFLLWR